MQVLRFSNHFLLVFSFIFSLFLTENTMASGCGLLLPCVAYSRADAVFIGKLQKVTEDKETPENVIYAHFEVEKTFKGKVDKIETVKFTIRTNERKFITGKKYFVYKENSASYNPCNNTHLYYEEDPHFIYANSLSETNPIFTISGRIENLTDNEIENVKISIEGEQSKHEPMLDSKGNFSIKVAKKGAYYVKILLPFDAAVDVKYDNVLYTAEVTHLNNQTTIKYKAEVKPNSCDYKEIEFYKDYKIKFKVSPISQTTNCFFKKLLP